MAPKLNLNEVPPKAMVTSNNLHANDLRFAIDGEPIPNVDSLNLLGTAVEKSLYFTKHVSKIAKEVGKHHTLRPKVYTVYTGSKNGMPYQMTLGTLRQGRTLRSQEK